MTLRHHLPLSPVLSHGLCHGPHSDFRSRNESLDLKPGPEEMHKTVKQGCCLHYCVLEIVVSHENAVFMLALRKCITAIFK